VARKIYVAAVEFIYFRFYYITLLSIVAGHIVDVDENESAPSAPSVELMDHVVGYEEVSFDASEFCLATKIGQ
jgi:hypothetical protein